MASLLKELEDRVGQHVRPARVPRVHAGVLTPWCELPLTELAARYNLRTSALALALHGLVADGLLSVHTTVAVVPPPSVSELVSVQN